MSSALKELLGLPVGPPAAAAASSGASSSSGASGSSNSLLRTLLGPAPGTAPSGSASAAPANNGGGSGSVSPLLSLLGGGPNSGGVVAGGGGGPGSAGGGGAVPATPPAAMVEVDTIADPVALASPAEEGGPLVFRARGGKAAVQLPTAQVAKFPLGKGKTTANHAIACNNTFLCYSKQSGSALAAAGPDALYTAPAQVQIKGRPGTPHHAAQQKVLQVAGAVACLAFAGPRRDYLCCTTVAGLLYVWKLGFIVADDDREPAAAGGTAPPPGVLSVTAMSVAYAAHPDRFAASDHGHFFRHVCFHPSNVLQLLVTDGWQAAAARLTDLDPHPDEEAAGIPELADADGACAGDLVVRTCYNLGGGGGADDQALPLELKAVGYAGGPHGSDVAFGVGADGVVRRLLLSAPAGNAAAASGTPTPLPSVPQGYGEGAGAGTAPPQHGSDFNAGVGLFTSSCAVAPRLFAVSGGGAASTGSGSAGEAVLSTWMLDTAGGARGRGQAHGLQRLAIVPPPSSSSSSSSSSKKKRSSVPSSSAARRGKSGGSAAGSGGDGGAGAFELLPTPLPVPFLFLLERQSGALCVVDATDEPGAKGALVAVAEYALGEDVQACCLGSSPESAALPPSAEFAVFDVFTITRRGVHAYKLATRAYNFHAELVLDPLAASPSTSRGAAPSSVSTAAREPASSSSSPSSSSGGAPPGVENPVLALLAKAAGGSGGDSSGSGSAVTAKAKTPTPETAAMLSKLFGESLVSSSSGGGGGGGGGDTNKATAEAESRRKQHQQQQQQRAEEEAKVAREREAAAARKAEKAAEKAAAAAAEAQAAAAAAAKEKKEKAEAKAVAVAKKKKASEAREAAAAAAAAKKKKQAAAKKKKEEEEEQQAALAAAEAKAKEADEAAADLAAAATASAQARSKEAAKAPRAGKKVTPTKPQQQSKKKAAADTGTPASPAAADDGSSSAAPTTTQSVQKRKKKGGANDEPVGDGGGAAAAGGGAAASPDTTDGANSDDGGASRVAVFNLARAPKPTDAASEVLRRTLRQFAEDALQKQKSLSDKRLLARAEKEVCVSFSGTSRWSSWFAKVCQETRRRVQAQQRSSGASDSGGGGSSSNNSNNSTSTSGGGSTRSGSGDGGGGGGLDAAEVDARIQAAVQQAVSKALASGGGKGGNSKSGGSSNELSNRVEDLRRQVASLQETVQVLLVRGTRSEQEEEEAAEAAASLAQRLSPTELRAKTLHLLSRGDSQRAFDLALSANDVSVVEWLCAKAREPGFLCSLDNLHLSQELWVCLMQQLSSNLEHGSTSAKLHDIEIAFSNVDFAGSLSTTFVTEVVAGVARNIERAIEVLAGGVSVSIVRRMHFLARMMSTAL